jgi:hypothetical protein
MIQIKNAKVSRSGDLHYIAIPIDFIRSEIVKPEQKYDIKITPSEKKEKKE